MLNTSQKIGIARLLSNSILALRSLFFLSSHITKKKNGITWALDLKEGIDFSIYLLGGFEVSTLRAYKKLIGEGYTILDIGANIGAHTLPLAQLVGSTGKVIAFEPTQYAFNKLNKNISLNPMLSSRITAQQIMLGNNASELPNAIYSSWPLENSNDLHKEHLGRLMSTAGATKATLDDYVEASNLKQINSIKLDVDGNEYNVLSGGEKTLNRFKPALLMELAPYVYKSCPEEFDKILMMLWNLGYEITNIGNGKRLPHNPLKVRQLIPLNGGINTLAIATQ